MDNKFFTFAKPFFDYIDNGNIFRKPIGWLYGIIAVVNLMVPFYLLYLAIDNGLFQGDAPGKLLAVFFLIWLVVSFVSWISFQLWWNRMPKVISISEESSDFVAIPVASHFIQTLGEWFGSWIAVVGSLSSIIVLLVLGDEARYLGAFIKNFNQMLSFGIIGSILYGFLVVVMSRLIAELIRAMASIANNTKR